MAGTTLVAREWRVTVRVPAGLPTKTGAAIQRVLGEIRLSGHIRRAVRAVLGRYPALAAVRVTVTR